MTKEKEVLRQLQKQNKPISSFRNSSSKDAIEFSKRQELLGTSITWQDSKEIRYCQGCNIKFSLSKRKHHCRICGKIFCSACSDFKVVLSGQLKRSCQSCSEEMKKKDINSHRKSEDNSNVIYSGKRFINNSNEKRNSLSSTISESNTPTSFFSSLFFNDENSNLKNNEEDDNFFSSSSFQSSSSSASDPSCSFSPYIEGLAFLRCQIDQEPVFFCEKLPNTKTNINQDILDTLKKSLLSEDFQKEDSYMKLNSKVLLRFPINNNDMIEKFTDEDGDLIGSPVLNTTEFYNCYVSLFHSPTSSKNFQAFIIITKWLYPSIAFDMIKKIHEALFLQAIDSTFFNISISEIKTVYSIAFSQILLWPDPIPNKKLCLTFFGDLFYLDIYNNINYFQIRDQNITQSQSTNENDQIISNNFQYLLNSDLISLLGPLGLIHHLWTIWEWLILGKDIVILSSSPSLCSEVVLTLASLLLPTQRVGDVRPFISCEDPNLLILAATAQLKREINSNPYHTFTSNVNNLVCKNRSMIIGVSNPNCLKLFEDFDSAIYLFPMYTNDITFDQNILKKYIMDGLKKNKVDHCILSQYEERFNSNDHSPTTPAGNTSNRKSIVSSLNLKSKGFIKSKDNSFFTAFKQWKLQIQKLPSSSSSLSNSWIVSRFPPSTYVIRRLIKRLKSLDKGNDIIDLGNKYIRSHFHEMTQAYFSPSPDGSNISSSPSSIPQTSTVISNNIANDNNKKNMQENQQENIRVNKENNEHEAESQLEIELEKENQEEINNRRNEIKKKHGIFMMLIYEFSTWMNNNFLPYCKSNRLNLLFFIILISFLLLLLLFYLLTSSPSTLSLLLKKYSSSLLFGWILSSSLWVTVFVSTNLTDTSSSSFFNSKTLLLTKFNEFIEYLIENYDIETQSKSHSTLSTTKISKKKKKISQKKTYPNFSGIWQRTSHNNLEKFLEAQGIGYVPRKLAMNLNPLVNISMDPNGKVIRLKEKAGPIESDISYIIYKNWEEAQDPSLRIQTKLGTTKFSDVCYWENDNIVIRKLILPDKEYELIITRTLVNSKEIIVKALYNDLLKVKQVEAQFTLAFQSNSLLPLPPIPENLIEKIECDEEFSDENNLEIKLKDNNRNKKIKNKKILSLKPPKNDKNSSSDLSPTTKLSNITNITPKDLTGIWEQENSTNLEEFLRACGASYFQTTIAPHLTFTHNIIMNPPYLNAIHMEEKVGSMIILISEASIGLRECNLELPLQLNNGKSYVQKAYWEDDKLFIIRKDKELSHEIIFIRSLIESNNRKKLNFIAIYKNLINNTEVKMHSTFVKIHQGSSSYNPVPNPQLLINLKAYIKSLELTAEFSTEEDEKNKYQDDENEDDYEEEKITYRLLDSAESFSNLSSAALNQLAAVPAITTSKQGALFNGVWSPLRSTCEIMDQHISIDGDILAIIEISFDGEIKNSLTLEINGDSCIEHVNNEGIGLDFEDDISIESETKSQENSMITQYRIRSYWDSDSLVIHKVGEKLSFDSEEAEIITEEWVTREIMTDGFTMSMRINKKNLISNIQTQSTNYYARR